MKKSKSTINSYSELLLIKQELKSKVNTQEKNMALTYMFGSKILELIKATRNDKKNKTNKEVYNLLYPYVNELASKIIDYKNKDSKQKDVINIVLSMVVAVFTTDVLSRKINDISNKKAK